MSQWLTSALLATHCCWLYACLGAASLCPLAVAVGVVHQLLGRPTAQTDRHGMHVGLGSAIACCTVQVGNRYLQIVAVVHCTSELLLLFCRVAEELQSCLSL